MATAHTFAPVAFTAAAHDSCEISTGEGYARHLNPGKQMNPDRPFTLVLSGGGLKGLAHIGVLRALEERGLVPSLVVGSSIGALIGAAWAAGASPQRMEARALQVRRRDVFQVDGAVVENLPVRLAASLGEGPIIAIIVAAISIRRQAHETAAFAASYHRGL